MLFVIETNLFKYMYIFFYLLLVIINQNRKCWPKKEKNIYVHIKEFGVIPC